MRRTAATILVGALTLTCAGAAGAVEAPQGAVFSIMGPASCSRWPARGSIESAAKAVPLNWILGFLSGEAEKSNARLFEGIQPEKVSAWVDAYCQANPQATLPAAARALTVELEAEYAPPPPPPSPMFRPVPPPEASKPATPPAAKRSAPRRPAARRPAPKAK